MTENRRLSRLTRNVYFAQFWRLGSLSSRRWQIWLGQGSSWLVDELLLTDRHMAEGGSKCSRVSSCKGTDFITRALPTCPKAPPLNTTTLGVRVST